MSVFGLVLMLLGGQAAAPSASVDIASLGWLAGCWSRATEGRLVEEHWMKPAGGTMIGMSRTIAGGKTVEYEFLQLRQQGSGVAYIAKPSKQAEASFPWVSGDAGSARFENPSHDFPQTITYTLKPDGSLHARIEGTINGAPRAVDFPMRKGC